MPHFGLMDADSLGPEKAALQRARLHIRAGKRRLRQGKISAGIVTLYDALEQALEWYGRARISAGEVGLDKDETQNCRSLFAALQRRGLLVTSFDVDSFDALAERALHEEFDGLDYSEVLAGIEGVMTNLGVMPFDETDLPPEEPTTF